MKKVISLFLIIIFLSACTIVGKTTIASTPGHLTSVKEVSKIDDILVNNVNQFAFALYNELNDNNNMFISPISIYLALGMTYNGASNNTALEMSKLLNAEDISLEKFNQLCRDLQYSILGYKDSKFELANSIWIKDIYKNAIKKDFLERNKTYYGAMISSLDFNNDKAKDVINNWVMENTNGRIEKTIEKIDPLTVMFLINTIYFNADWENPFESKNTKDALFYGKSSTKTVQMMSKIDELSYVENDLLQGALLPYEGDKTSMFVLLPKNDIDSLELNEDRLKILIEKMKENKKKINIRMPKVVLEYKKELKEPLTDLGMVDAWSENADFSKMSERAKQDGLFINSITHKSFLTIDEKGTEVAAATNVEINLTAIPNVDITMDVDHPYVVGIVDNKNNTILFIGNIYNP